MTNLFSALVIVTLLSAGLSAQGTARGQGTPPSAAKPAPVDKAFAPLQGVWVIDDINGEPPASMLLVFKGDKYEQLINDAVVERGTIKLDAAKKPTAIDLVIQEGGDAGKLQIGIVEITGDKMKLKLGLPSATARPANFNVEEGGIMANLTRRK